MSEKRLTGLGLDLGTPEISFPDRVDALARAGFEAAFCCWKDTGFISQIAAKLKENSMIFQSVHAPFKHIDKLWTTGEKTDAAMKELTDCLEGCAANDVNLVVSHVWIGFGEEHPNDIGIENFARLLDRAKELGITIAFENTEGEKYLEYVRDNLFSYPNAGFCIDTGHEMCYNSSRDMISKYGKNGKLIATHLNDNMGITGQEITWLDDSHLIPFDGRADWQNIVNRLASVGYNGILTCELTTKNKPERNTHDRYAKLSFDEYLKLVHERAVKIGEMLDDAEKQAQKQ